MTIKPATTLTTDDLLALKVRVRDVKPSDHSYYGLHDLITLEVVDPDGDLPAGLVIQVRRTQDGTADLRSAERRAKDAARPNPEVDLSTLKKADLLVLAEKRKVEVPAKATKAQLVEALTA